MSQLFARKPIAELQPGPEGAQSLRRVLGAGDLVMLAIGAVIGAGIFGAIGTAAAGQIGPDGAVIRYGAGPALVFSFLLLGAACALAALCYAELAAMIPQAGSAYAYSYATLGELVAWIIGWDLILEYAVGNVAVAISWGDYFTTLLRGVGLQLPVWMTTGYRTALLSSDPAVHGLIETAPRVAGVPILLNVPAFGIVMLITWLLLRGVRESSTANNIMVVIKLLALGLFIVVGLMNIHPANYHPFAPNGFKGIHQGAAIVFFAYIGFDAISTAAEETRDPQRNLPIGILGGLGDLHGHLRHRRSGADRDGAVSAAGGGRSARARFRLPATRAPAGSWRWAPRFRCRRCCSCSSTASRAFSSRWRATACCPHGPPVSTHAPASRMSPRCSPESSLRSRRSSATRRRPTT